MLTKNTLINIGISLWIIISAGYIGYDLFSKFTVNVMQKSYSAGQTDTINTLIAEANKGCDGFNVFSGEKKVTLINVDCLKAKNDLNTTTQTKDAK